MKILELEKEVENLKKIIYNDKEWGFNINLKDFITGIYIALTPQAYGVRLENFIKHKIGKNCKSVDSKIGRGDLKYNDKYIEVKASIITSSNDSLNMVQIRENQEIDYYVLVAFDKRNMNQFDVHAFLLTKDEIIKEMIKMNASSAHGTKNAIKSNKVVEKRVSLKIDSSKEHFQRWKSKYEVSLDNLHKMI